VLENKEGRFTPGLFARVQLIGSGEREAILIDDRAIGTDQGQRFVLAVSKNNTLEYRRVELGKLIDGLRIVSGEISRRDSIVTEGVQHLRPGMQIVPASIASRERSKIPLMGADL
jgi:multidrug efflux system membrane fusion protein